MLRSFLLWQSRIWFLWFLWLHSLNVSFWDILDLFFRQKKKWNASCKNWSNSLATLFPDVHYDFLLSVTLAGKNTKVVWKCTTAHIKWLTGELRFDGSLPRVIVCGWIKLHSRMKCLWTGSPQVPSDLLIFWFWAAMVWHLNQISHFQFFSVQRLV